MIGIHKYIDRLRQHMSDSTRVDRKNPSKAWYLFPIFLSLIGGLIMFFCIKDENRQMAKNGLVLGAILTVVGIIIAIIFSLLSLSAINSIDTGMFP